MEDINPRNIDSFMRLVGDAARPVIVTHAKPDGDAIGSSVAMYHFLRMAGKSDVRLVLNDRYPAFLDFIASQVLEEDIIIHDVAPGPAEIPHISRCRGRGRL